DIGDDETPDTVAPVVLGLASRSISTGGEHTCARLDDASLRCWGRGQFGRLGYGNESNIGDDESPAAAGPVNLKVVASIDDGAVREGNSGATPVTLTVTLSTASDAPASVAYATADRTARAPSDYAARSGTLTFAAGETRKTITVDVAGDSDDEPDERFAVILSSPVNLALGRPEGGVTILDDDDAAAAAATTAPGVSAVDTLDAALRLQAKRAADLRACRAAAASTQRSASNRARRRYRQRRTRARVLRMISATAARRRAQCLKRFGRTPGRVTSLGAARASATTVVLTFKAAGSDGSKPPAARGYLIKQSLRPIRSAREFARATSLCGGTCRLEVTRPGSELTLRVTDLSRRTTYYYAIAAKDNVSGRVGPRSRTVFFRTR
ncbi:MAG: Calx-beta domain-containing protein, partial [Solirubrobacteraceae bacterium]